MGQLVYLVLAALVAVGLRGGRLGDEVASRLRAELGAGAEVAVEVELPADRARLGHIARLSATVHDVDARELPLASMVPVPRPRAVKGRIDRLELQATGVTLDSFRASEVSFLAEGLTYDLQAAVSGGEVRATGLAAQRLEVIFRDGDLDAHLAAEYPELMGATMTFEAGRLVVRARVPVIFAAFDVEVSGALAIRDGRQVYLKDATIATGRIELSEQVRQGMLERLDPLLDLDDVLAFPVPLTWTEIAVGDGEARALGQLETPESPEVRRRFQPRWRYE